MMKRLTIALKVSLLLLLSIDCQAQTSIFSENFDAAANWTLNSAGNTIITGSLPNPGGNPNTWTINNTGTTIDGSNNLHITCSGFLCNILGAPGPIYNASGGGNNTNTAALMNTDISAATFTGGGPFTLSFQWICEGASTPSNASARLIYSIDGGVNWIERPTNYNGNGGGPITESIDMATLVGFIPTVNNIRLGFRWFNIGTTGHADPPMIVDNINITIPSSTNTLTTGTITGSPFCAGSTFTVPFTSSGTFTAGNIYTAQLSNASGNFGSAVNIGTLNSSANSGTISVTIPPGTPTGSGYLIRVISDNPAITGTSSLAFTVNAPVTPTFTPITNVCQNATAPPLLTNSNDFPSIAGTWNPATINTSLVGTTTYTFTPNANQCATVTTMDIVINNSITPTFSIIDTLCVGSVATPLPSSSNDSPSIAGTWNPATINTSLPGTTTYTFTPNANQCATVTTIDIVISNSITPTFSIIDTLCVGSVAPPLPTSSNNSPTITGTWNPATINTNIPGTTTYTFTPNANQCATVTTIDIVISNSITPTFSNIDTLCLGSVAPPLPISSNNSPSITGTWNPATINTSLVGTTTYTFTPDPNQCATVTTMDIVISNSITPTFSNIDTLCLGSVAPPLPTSSNNSPSITGTWNPATINTSLPGTTTYTFTPDPNQCATVTTMDIVISNSIPPTFSNIDTLCLGSVAPPLPTSSNNSPSITGTWNPATINTSLPGTTTYTFTPDPNQCATVTTMDIVITNSITPTFSNIDTLCVGSIAPPLPTSSNNSPSITGTWNPATINTSFLGTTTYTFTANPNQCATVTTMDIVIANSITPTFSNIVPLCLGSVAPPLPTGSNNFPSITGTWNPATINTSLVGTTTYTFTPDPGQCGSTTTLDVEVIPAPPAPSITIAASVTTICAGQSVDFTATPNSSNTGDIIQWFINGNPVTGGTGLLFSSTTLNNNDQITAVFTPSSSCLAGQTGTSNLIIITVNPAVTPTISISTSTTQLCAGDNATFNTIVNGGGSTPAFQWFINNNAVAGATSNSFSSSTLSNLDAITVQLTSSLACAVPNTVTSNSLTMFVLPYGTPGISISADRSVICVGQVVNLNATIDTGGAAPQFNWQIGGSNFTTTVPTFALTGLNTSTSVSCTLTSNYACLSTTSATSSNIDIQVNPIPTVSLSDDVTIQEGETTNLTATATAGMTYLWTPSASLTCSDCLTPTASPIETTVYQFTATDPATSCNANDSLKVTVIRNYDIWVPTAFSPNGDSNNDYFFVRGNNVKDFTIRLYDRWGTIVFETSNLAEGWNGEYQNRLINSCVLTYVLNYTLNDGTTEVQKGNITVSN